MPESLGWGRWGRRSIGVAVLWPWCRCQAHLGPSLGLLDQGAHFLSVGRGFRLARIAQLCGPGAQVRKIVCPVRFGNVGAIQQREQVCDVVRALVRNLVVRENRLDPLLDGLLGVEPQAIVGDVRIVDEAEEIFSSPAAFSISS